MVENRFRNYRSTIPKHIEDCILNLHRKGKSSGEIVDFIYDSFDICYYSKRIRKIIKDHQRMSDEFVNYYLENLTDSKA